MAAKERRNSPGMSKTWLVEAEGGHHLGEVEATDSGAAEAEARRHWPSETDILVGLKSAVEDQRRRVQGKIDRDPGPSAYHEAGHVVVGTLGEGRLRVERVMIGSDLPLHGDSYYTGQVRWESDPPDSRYPFDNQLPQVAQARIIQALAGNIAEWVHGRRKRPPRLQGSDLAYVDQYASHHCRCEALSFYGPNLVQDQFIEWLNGRAKWAVASCWGRIERVAEALIERRELSGDEVRTLIKEGRTGSGSSDDFDDRLRFLGLAK